MAKTEKTRRHSGRVTPRPTIKESKIEIINQCLDPQEFYDDWQNYRDSFRGCNDKTKLRNNNMRLANYFDVNRWNKKIKTQIKVRKAKKEMKL